MTDAEITAFHESFERCMVSGRRFFDVFYNQFLLSPEVAAKFQGTDFERQKRMLKLSLYVMLGVVVLKSSAYSMLVAIARRHGRDDRNIPPHLYTLWLDSLIFAARKCDWAFNDQIEAVWRKAMQPGIDYIASFH
jgi:hypothetical protein